MMKWLLFLIMTCSLFATPDQNYFDLVAQYPQPIGDHQKGEIEIVTQIEALEVIEDVAKQRLLRKGVALDKADAWSRTGIIAEDQYLYWIRDGVIFPSGGKGTYDRIVWKSGLDGAPGIAIFPYLEDRKIILNLNYRHATRSWEIELPRGMREKGESLRSASLRELKEETGYQLDDLVFLGSIAVDSGILSSEIPIIACKATQPGDRNQDDSEAIHTNLVLHLYEVEEALLQGFLNVTIQNRTFRANVRDPFLAYALLQMKLRDWKGE